MGKSSRIFSQAPAHGRPLDNGETSSLRDDVWLLIMKGMIFPIGEKRPHHEGVFFLIGKKWPRSLRSLGLASLLVER